MSENTKPKPVKQAPSKPTATYVGGLSGVTVVLPSGRVVTFNRGETHTILVSERAALANHPDFKLATEAKEET